LLGVSSHWLKTGEGDPSEPPQPIPSGKVAVPVVGFTNGDDAWVICNTGETFYLTPDGWKEGDPIPQTERWCQKRANRP